MNCVKTCITNIDNFVKILLRLIREAERHYLVSIVSILLLLMTSNRNV